MGGPPINFVGDRFGRLLVNSLSPERRNKHKQWHCTCDCGENVLVSSPNLRSGTTNSCGCLRREMAEERGRKRAIRPEVRPLLRRALELGTAGEHLVCADILISGHRCTMAAAGMPYDIIADVDGELFKIAVKASNYAFIRRDYIDPVYYYGISRAAPKRGPNAGKTVRYTLEDVSIVALVELEKRRICYIPITSCPASISLQQDTFRPKKSRYGRGDRMNGDDDDFSLIGSIKRLKETLYGE